MLLMILIDVSCDLHVLGSGAHPQAAQTHVPHLPFPDDLSNREECFVPLKRPCRSCGQTIGRAESTLDGKP
jgi:hypothetical protein